jgi:hypothetical protein
MSLKSSVLSSSAIPNSRSNQVPKRVGS